MHQLKHEYSLEEAMIIWESHYVKHMNEYKTYKRKMRELEVMKRNRQSSARFR